MESCLLPETDSLLQVFLRPTFAVPFSVTTLLMLATNYLMEKSTVENSNAPAVLVTANFFVNVFSFTLFIAGITFANSTQITRAIAVGQSPPIKLSVLRSLPWPLSVVCGSEGDRKLLPFLFYSLVFPGGLVVLSFHLISLGVNGLENALWWQLPLQRYLAWTMLWRLFVSAGVFATNYLAAHNPTQSVLIRSNVSDGQSSNSGRKLE
ncbi:unspecified product [Leishmania tarentolae]|uniref:Unspecified product n=1 Tax=Leishmania tarentolae TaxID=5689 RepID=A0A640KDK6_LEITA|nr:unspecified product [Leishmania tarentolae]